MPKPGLISELDILEHQIIATLIEGLKTYRPDLTYPQSHSDMQACVRGLLTMFDVKRLPLARKLRYPCPNCGGMGCHEVHIKAGVSKCVDQCLVCKGLRYVEE